MGFADLLEEVSHMITVKIAERTCPGRPDVMQVCNVHLLSHPVVMVRWAVSAGTSGSM